jgi:predicted site-specific integrase-resolvase
MNELQEKYNSLENDFLKGKKASELLGVHSRTLYQWEEKGKIETIRTSGNMRLYNVGKYLRLQLGIEEGTDDINENCESQLNICYCRVSSQGQRDDLQRQIEFMKERYPEHQIITDVGSGLNLNKKGIKRIVKLAIEGKIKELVIAYKDRLARFGYDLIENLIKDYSKGKITVVFQKEDKDVQAEIVEDLMSILNVYTAKMNGLRKYKKS